jgi:NitT/TauT family transport system substrate-binding protein
MHRFRAAALVSSLASAAFFCLPLLAGPAFGQDKVTFGTNWRAQAEHGGYYQAVATGIYRKYNLDVTIRQGGPQINNSQLLAAGRIDFNMGGSTFNSLNYLTGNIPVVTVAAMFQKDPTVLISHPGAGNDTVESIKGKPLLLATEARANIFPFLKMKYGFVDEQVRPYTFNPQPFLVDKSASQQGYLTSEPFTIEQQAGFRPVVHLLADSGFNALSTTVEVTRKLVTENPDLVQRFVDASIEGWIGYLNGDPSAANALIKKDNPEMTDALMANAIALMKQYGIVQSGDALTVGVGAMTEKRLQEFFDFTVAAGLYPKDLDYRKAFDLRFVNKRHGM